MHGPSASARTIGRAGGERGRPPLGGEPVAGEVGRERAIASAERRDRPPPALPRLGEAVKEDERRGHAAIDDSDEPHLPAAAPDTYLGLRAFVDELARCGVREACTSPGSRSTPLVLSLAREPRIRATSHLDERSGGLLRARDRQGERCPRGAGVHVGHRGRQLRARGDRGARGARAAARPDRRPPARAARPRRRADDRPDQALRHRGQVVRRGRRPHRDPGAAAVAAPARVPRVLDRRRRPARARAPELLAARAARARRPAARRRHRPRRRPPVRHAPEDGTAGRHRRCSTDSKAELEARPRAVLVAGRAERDPALGPALAAFAERAAIPLLADPLSGARRGPAADRPLRRAAARPGLAAGARSSSCASGDLPTSKPLRAWLHGLDDALQLAFDPEGAWQDPGGAVATILAADPRATLEAIQLRKRDHGWLDRWQRADRAAAAAIARALSPDRTQRAARGGRARRDAPAGGDRGGGVLDAGARRRDVLPGARAPAARAGQPRRQRHRRDGLDRIRGRHRRALVPSYF